MRLFLVLAAALLFVSCSSTSISKLRIPGDYTKADLATMRLRDLNPLANRAPVVPVHQATLRAISEERLAQLNERRGFLWFRKPLNYTPPTLPDGSIALDGSLLPAKTGGSLAVLNVDGYLTAEQVANSSPPLTAEGQQGFSIE